MPARKLLVRNRILRRHWIAQGHFVQGSFLRAMHDDSLAGIKILVAPKKGVLRIDKCMEIRFTTLITARLAKKHARGRVG
jgi:hypothetical protein